MMPTLLDPAGYDLADFFGATPEDQTAARDEVVAEWNGQIMAAAAALSAAGKVLGVNWYQHRENPMVFMIKNEDGTLLSTVFADDVVKKLEALR